MNILVIGASSGIGYESVLRGAARGHRIRAMSRSGRADYPETVESFAGDALNSEDIVRALDGVDAVISAIGIGTHVLGYMRPVSLFSGAAAVLLPAMEANGPKRLVLVTGFGAGNSKAAMSWPERQGHNLILGRAYADKDRQEAMVMASPTLDWTIVRPVILTNGSYTGRIGIEADPSKWRNGVISRADVAAYLIDAVETGRDSHKAVVLRREG